MPLKITRSQSYFRVAILPFIFRLNIWQYWYLEDLTEICEELWKRVYTLEGEKFHLERDFRIRVFEVLLLTFIIR